MLNQIVNEWQTRDPALVLELMHKQIRRALNQDNSTGKAHASMDICLVSIDLKRKKGTFAGASRPLFLIQDGVLKKIPGDPRSVGGFQREEQRFFTNNNIDLSKPTSMYLTTDGYMDQMDDEFKKFGQKRFTQLLLDIYDEPIDTQNTLLLSAFENHRNGHEQIDDICILGLKM
jgi:serine phosphatase RsbU (regulator of sigma subunit)